MLNKKLKTVSLLFTLSLIKTLLNTEYYASAQSIPAGTKTISVWGVTYGYTDVKDPKDCFSNAPQVIWVKNICYKVTNWCRAGCPVADIQALGADVQINFGAPAVATLRYQPVDFPI